MTEAQHKKHRHLARLLSAANVLLILVLQPFNGIAAGDGPSSLPFIAYFLITGFSYMYLYKHSGKDKRFAMLLLPIALLIIALFSYLTTARFD